MIENFEKRENPMEGITGPTLNDEIKLLRGCQVIDLPEESRLREILKEMRAIRRIIRDPGSIFHSYVQQSIGTFVLNHRESTSTALWQLLPGGTVLQNQRFDDEAGTVTRLIDDVYAKIQKDIRSLGSDSDV